MIRKVLFNLVRIVESAIAEDIKKAKHGAIMHDGWSKFGTHYVALFAQYNRTVIQNTGKIRKTVLMPASALLAMRPMAGLSEKEEKGRDNENDSSDDNEEEVNQEATTFTAEVHAEFFRDVMKSYDVELKDWALCQVKLHFICCINTS